MLTNRELREKVAQRLIAEALEKIVELASGSQYYSKETRKRIQELSQRANDLAQELLK